MKRKCVECARQWRATCGQQTLVLLTEKSGCCVPLGIRSAFLQRKQLMARLTGESKIQAQWAGYYEELYRVDHRP